MASPVTSLFVLERLDQYLRYKIEPPKSMSFHDEWVKRRAAEDDPIAAAKAKSDHLSRLLNYWEERVKWWNDPIPPQAHAEERRLRQRRGFCRGRRRGGWLCLVFP